ncbi:calcium/sodium antiporter [uncultured Chloroflexus sp.]|uniref:calcium/sodium antiporter n=1 Tax=uncultured Chloroflexus sp. TaxID=214040 RepID=UPI0026382B38|nr:calcium/sodium antiporter [uncultured Chloroflexus sp.]
MDVITIGLLVGGLTLLTVGGELLVRGSSQLAALARISPLVIGLTVVSFGTSSPELAVSIQAGLAGKSDIAVGNVVGSNIFNILFILGACAVISPLIVAVQLIRREVPFMIAVSLLLAGLALDGRIGRLDGVLLFGLLIGYIVWSIYASRKEGVEVQAEYEQEFGPTMLPNRSGTKVWFGSIGFIVIGLGLLALGSHWLVEGAVVLARAFGVSDVIIGLTIVAAGTSLPEVVASIIATLKQERDIAIGNAIGSNIFNILGILGIAALVTPNGLTVVPALSTFDIPVMIAVAFAALPIFVSRLSINRWEGLLFLGYYVAYTAYLILAATHHDALPAFSSVMALFVLPITALTLLVLMVNAVRRRDWVASHPSLR